MHAWNQRAPEEGVVWPETGVQMVVSLYEGAVNQTQVLWKNSQSSYLPSHLSSFISCVYKQEHIDH